MSCKVASFPIVEDFSHFEGVSPLPFPESYPSWPTEPSKSESLPLEHNDSLDVPVLLSYCSVKEPPALFSFGSGKEPPAFLSYVSGKDTDMNAFASDLSITVSGTFSSLPPALSAASFSQSSFSSFSSSSGKLSVIGSSFCETLLLPSSFPAVKQEPKEESNKKQSRAIPQPIVTQSQQTTANNRISAAPTSDLSDLTDSTDSTSSFSSSADLTSSCESVASSPDSSSTFTLLSLLDGDKHKSLSERKQKPDRKTTKREREEKKQPQKRGRKKRNSDESDGGSEFDSNDSGCWAESKKERNKKAASNYRKRRKQYVGELEAKVAGLQEKSSKDRANVVSMTGELQVLKERIESLENLLTQNNVDFPKRKPSTSTCGKSNKRARN